MSEFPQRLKGEPLQKLYSKALETLSEEQIGYYKKLFYAFANLYGIIPIRKIYELLTDNYGMEISEKSFLDLCEYFRYEQESYFYIFGKEEYYQEDTSPASEPMDRLLAFDSFVEFDDAYELVLSLKEGKPWYVPPIEELEKYEDDLYFEKTKAFDSVIGFLKDEFKLDFIDSESKIYDAFFTLKLEDHNFNDFLDELQQSGLDITFERVQKLAPYYTELNNNTRMQANNGYTPAETEKLREEFGFSGDSLYISELHLSASHERERYQQMNNQIHNFRTMRTMLSQGSLANDILQKPKNRAETIPAPAEAEKNTRNAAEDRKRIKLQTAEDTFALGCFLCV